MCRSIISNVAVSFNSLLSIMHDIIAFLIQLNLNEHASTLQSFGQIDSEIVKFTIQHNLLFILNY